MNNVLCPAKARRSPKKAAACVSWRLFPVFLAAWALPELLLAVPPCSPDLQPPAIVFCPPDGGVECGTPLTPPNTGGTALAVDACDPAPLVTYADRGPLTVMPADLDGWVFAVQGLPLTAVAEMTAGPGTPPLGSGSFHVSIGANGENLTELRNFGFDQVPLAKVTELSYRTYRTMDGAGLNRSIYLMLNVDTDGNGAGDDVIYFEPRFQSGSNPALPDQGPTVTGVWQKWDAHHGGWWSINHPEVMTPGPGVQSLATYLAAFPGARIVNSVSGGGVRLSAGGGAGAWDFFDGHADYLVLGTNGVSQAYDFDVAPATVCPTVIIRTWTAADQSGNAVSCSQKLTVADTTAPVLSCGSDRTVACHEAWDFDEPTATDACGAVTLTLVSAVTNTTCPFSFVATRTWRAIDPCGNVAECTQTVSSADTQPPVVAGPADVTVECTESVAPAATGTATASDNCDPQPTVTWSDTETPGACPQERVITRTWTATDACGNAASVDQTITVADRTPPVVTCPPSETVECGTPWSFDLPAGTDACGPVTVTEVSTVTNSACGDTMTVSRTWLVADACGLGVPCVQTITVQDTLAPIVTCVPDKTVECGLPWAFDVPSYSDECVFESLVFDNSVNDAQWRFSSGTTEVGDEIVLAGAARQITRFAFEYFGVNRNTQAEEFEGSVTARVRFYANDGPGEYPSPQTVLYDSGEFAVPATVRSVVTIEDFQLEAVVPLAGNVPDSFTWTVQFGGLGPNDDVGLDIYNPIVLGLSYPDYWERTPQGWQLKAHPDVKIDFAARIEAARENVQARVLSTVTNTLDGQTIVATRTWEVVDPCDNRSECSQNVTVLDSIPPVVTCPGIITTNIVYGPCEQVVAFTTTATDAGIPVPVVCVPSSGSAFPKGTTTVTCTATDARGNQGSCSFPVVVVPPTFTQTVNRLIPDGDPGGLTNRLTVTTPITFLTDVEVTLNLAHSWNGDLHAFLVHNTGRAVLLNRVGRRAGDLLGYSDDGFSVTLDDEAAGGDIHVYRMQLFGNPTTPLVGPLTGLWAPDGRDTPPAQALESDPRTALLSAFRGMDPNGVWTLVVADLQPGDAGLLQSWGVQFCGELGVPPTITAPPVSVTVECGTDATFSVTAIGSPPLSYQWYFGSAPIAGATAATLTVPGVRYEDLGDYSVVVRNDHGQATSTAATLSLVDTRLPEITCPPAITVPIPPGQCSVVVPNYGVSASDACGPVTVVCVPPAGQPLSAGTTPVHCIATDAALNTAECSFVVTAQDTEAPMLAACPADITVGTQQGQCAAAVPFTPPAPTDNCPGTAVTCVPPPGAIFPAGVTTVVCTAVDVGGNQAACTFTVTVLDTEAPEVCMDPPVLRSAGSEDDFAGPEPALASATLQEYVAAQALALRHFDSPDPDRWLAHSFGGLPANLSSARLRIHVRALGTASAEDTLQLAFSQPGGSLRAEQWTRRFGLFEAVPGLLPATWSSGTEAEFELDLARLPNADGTFANLMGAARDAGALDVLAGNDTDVDYVVLEVETCLCSTDLVVDSDPALCGARVPFPPPLFFDNCDPNPGVVCTPPSGSVFAPGVTRVDCHAIDAGGNIGRCSFNVIVNDIGPKLSFFRSGADLVLSWPVGCGAWQLVEAADLANPVSWVPSSAPVSIVGSVYRATVPVSTPLKFFALRSPVP
ncbi:MAG: HYR domain-containing protein [Verrucomicrobia bacterium]|nr:HYR domain-containing protein [Verrucomicrobiota bacterium]